MPVKEHEIEIKVYAFDTDSSGVIFNANYFKWFYIGRHEFVGSCDIKIESNGSLLIGPGKERISIRIGTLNCRICRPSRLNDVIRMKTSIKGVRPKTVTFIHRLYDNKERLLVEGESVYVSIDPDRDKSVDMPPSVIEYFKDMVC